jgi:hypothetical protein
LVHIPLDETEDQWGSSQESPSFSEEKEAKRLLLLRRFHDLGHGRDLSSGARMKSLFLLFLRKEDASSNIPCTLTRAPYRYERTI